MDLPHLILMTDEARLPDPLAAAERLPRGAAVILRHYGDPGRAALAGELAALCRRRGLILSVAGELPLARRVAAPGQPMGLHLPAWTVRRCPVWIAAARRRGMLITAAAHDAAEIAAARRAGVDAVLLGPVFPTRSHPEARTLGPARFATLVRGAGLPVYALGGVYGGNAGRLLGSGAAGIAGIAGVV